MEGRRISDAPRSRRVNAAAAAAVAITLIPIRTRNARPSKCPPGGSGRRRDCDRECKSHRARGDQRDPGGAGGERGFDDPTLLVAAREASGGCERPHGEQNRQRMKAAKFSVSTSGVRAKRRWKQG